LLRLPTDEEIDRILDWLGTLTSPAQTQIEDLACFYGDRLESATNEGDRIASIVPRPHMFVTHISGSACRGTVCLGIRDNSAQTVLEAEAAQLPKTAPSLIFLDITSVIGSYPEWSPLIERRFQPNINRRIGGVVLYQTLHGAHGPTMAGTFLINPYARHPVPDSTVQMARKFCKKAD